MNRQNSAAEQRLLAAVRALAVPDAIREAKHAPVVADPVVGEIWRVAWGSAVMLVLVLNYQSGVVQVAPVILDVENIDHEGLVINAELSDLRVSFAPWLGLRCDLPERVLERKIADTTLHVERQGWAQALVAEQSAHWGRTPTSILDVSTEKRAVTQDALETFQDARWLDPSSGGLSRIVKDSGLPARELAKLLRADLSRVLSITRGLVPVTAEEAELIAPALGITVSLILAANPTPPTELVAYLERPRWRAQVQRLAHQNDQSETSAWRAAAYGTWNLAARQTGTDKAPAWEERLSRFFAMTLGGGS